MPGIEQVDQRDHMIEAVSSQPGKNRELINPNRIDHIEVPSESAQSAQVNIYFAGGNRLQLQGDQASSFLQRLEATGRWQRTQETGRKAGG